MDLNKIYHDFQKVDDEGRLVLTLNGTIRDIEKNHIKLAEGMKFVFWDDDLNDAGDAVPLTAIGTVEFNSKIQQWVARIE